MNTLTSIDIQMMTQAIIVSQKSGCVSQKIGCVISMIASLHDNVPRIVSEGYNGRVFFRNTANPTCSCANKHLLNEDGKLIYGNRPVHSEWSDREEIHSEMMAILNAHKNGVVLNNATLYTTQSPCNQCAKHIGFYGLHDGISRVVYLDKYDRGGDLWDKHLSDRGIVVEKFDKSLLDFINFDKLIFNNNEQ